MRLHRPDPPYGRRYRLPKRGPGLPVRKMRDMGLDECLVKWTDSFMRGRRVTMSVDGQEGEPMEVTMGLQQGSPISPVLFAIYIAEIHRAVEDENSRAITFVDDVTWTVEGDMSTRWFTNSSGVRQPVFGGQTTML